MNKTLTMMTYSLVLAIASPMVFADNSSQLTSASVIAQDELEVAIQQSAGIMSEQIRKEIQQHMKSDIRLQLHK